MNSTNGDHIQSQFEKDVFRILESADYDDLPLHFDSDIRNAFNLSVKLACMSRLIIIILRQCNSLWNSLPVGIGSNQSSLYRYLALSRSAEDIFPILVRFVKDKDYSNSPSRHKGNNLEPVAGLYETPDSIAKKYFEKISSDPDYINATHMMHSGVYAVGPCFTNAIQASVHVFRISFNRLISLSAKYNSKYQSPDRLLEVYGTKRWEPTEEDCERIAEDCIKEAYVTHDVRTLRLSQKMAVSESVPIPAEEMPEPASNGAEKAASGQAESEREESKKPELTKAEQNAWNEYETAKAAFDKEEGRKEFVELGHEKFTVRAAFDYIHGNPAMWQSWERAYYRAKSKSKGDAEKQVGHSIIGIQEALQTSMLRKE